MPPSIERISNPLLKSAARFPWERALLMVVAAVVGLYGGIAAGLFATAIRSVQLVLFRGGEVARALSQPEWLRLFRHQLAGAHWHLEFAALAALILAAALVLESGRRRLPRRHPRSLAPRHSSKKLKSELLCFCFCSEGECAHGPVQHWG